MDEEKKLTTEKEIDCVTKENEESKCQLYKYRWLILAIFMVYAVAAGMQWMQYSIITNIVVKFYNVEPYIVEWTTMLHMLAYVVCILPALWMLEKAVCICELYIMIVYFQMYEFDSSLITSYSSRPLVTLYGMSSKSLKFPLKGHEMTGVLQKYNCCSV